MNDEEIKSKCNINRVQEIDIGDKYKQDYIIDNDNNIILSVSPLEFKIIEKIKELELRFIKLEKKIK